MTLDTDKLEHLRLPAEDANALRAALASFWAVTLNAAVLHAKFESETDRGERVRAWDAARVANEAVVSASQVVALRLTAAIANAEGEDVATLTGLQRSVVAVYAQIANRFGDASRLVQAIGGVVGSA